MDFVNNKRLILICEGGAHTVEYFHRNKVYPGAVVLTTTKFKEMMPYLSKNDAVLVVIKGLTDFSMAEVYALFDDLDTAKTKLHSITVMTNIELGHVSMPYYLYEGDLFYGRVYEVVKGKKTEILTEQEQLDSKKKGKKVKKSTTKGKNTTSKENSTQPYANNAVISRYKEYNKRDIKLTIYGNEQRRPELSHDNDVIVSKLINVNLFQDNQ